MSKNPNMQVLGETESYAVWISEEPEQDDVLYHVELGNITVHLFPEEWEEFLHVMRQAMR